jgi:Ca2+-transporting ATPase
VTFPDSPAKSLPKEVPQAPAWHTLTSDDACARQGVDARLGLSAEEVERRLARTGPNRLAEKPARSAWLRFSDQFKSTLILILIAAAALAYAVGDLKDAVVILVVVVLNAVLGFYQESRAEQSLAALKEMLATKARVRRGGHPAEIDAQALVPGDIVLLEAGDRVPADGRLVEAHNIEIDESALTGESHTVGKHVQKIADAAAPLAERSNMVFMNTVVTRGRAELLVAATGGATEMGRIAHLMQQAPQEPTPLQRQLDRLGKRLALIAGIVVAVIFALALYQNQTLAKAALTAITLAVAAIPEGLPAVVTVTLALGMRRMAGKRAIVKRLAAVETLGCTTVICSDKTGTLTMNQMTARSFLFAGQRHQVSGEGYSADGEIAPEAQGGSASAPAKDADLHDMLLPAALCNDSRIRDGQLVGDPTEGALAALAAKGGVDARAAAEHLPRIAEIPFDSANKFMATFHHDGARVRLFVKGAPDLLLTRCTAVSAGGSAQALDQAGRTTLVNEIEAMAARGLRVLAVASSTLAAQDFDPTGDLMVHVSELTLQGLIGIMDPPRPQAREAIALCRTAGIQVKMITGDHRVTAAAVARELGLVGEALEGRELDRMDDAELTRCIEKVVVFARVAPEHKVRIVQLLKSLGHVVAMTGDGVNDAPALKSADIGVAMGITGTAVSKEAGSMVLTDDNFATIVGAVEEGRTIYDNIVKFVRFQFATNIGALGTVLLASLLGWPVPFNPIQILWVNMIMDGPPAMALALEPARDRLMRDPPRSQDADIMPWRRIGKLAAFGLTMTVGTLSVIWFAMQSGEPARAPTLGFTTFVLFQFFNVFNARAESGSVFDRHFFANRMLWLALVAVLGLQVVVVHWPPAQLIFETTDLSLADWLLATTVASTVLLLEEALKLAARLR